MCLRESRAGSIPISASFLFPADTMVCTGCCSCLDHIVTYLFKQLSRSTKKRTTPLTQESDRFLHIMQQHPEMIQQVGVAVRPLGSPGCSCCDVLCALCASCCAAPGLP